MGLPDDSEKGMRETELSSNCCMLPVYGPVR